MPIPTVSQVHTDGPLTNVSVAYLQDQSFYVADKVFPNVPVAHKSDTYYIWNKDDFLRDEAAERADGTETVGVDARLATGSYAAKVFGLHKDIGDQTRRNADPALNLDANASRMLTQKLLLQRERRFATSYFTTGVWGTDITPGTLWSAASPNPMADVSTGKTTILTNTGFLPNTLLLGYAVFEALRNAAPIRDQFKYTSPESITAEMMARYFDVEKVLVGKATVNPAKEGAASQAKNLILGKHALLCYVPPAASLDTPSAGYTFEWSGYRPGAYKGVAARTFRMENLASDRIEVEMAYDQRVIGSDLGYFFNSCVS